MKTVYSGCIRLLTPCNRHTDVSLTWRIVGGMPGLGVVRMDWPACSPDLNPIEHFWDHLERQVWENHPPPATLPALLGLLQQEWLAIPQAFLRRYAMSVRRRCVDCMGSGGGYTHYWLFSWTEMNMSDFCEFRKRTHYHKSVNKPWTRNQNVLKFCVHGAECQTELWLKF